MTINNQHGRTSFKMAPDRAVEGAIAEGPAPVGRPYPYPLRRSAWSVTFDDAEITDGVYTATLDLAGFGSLAFTMTVADGELLDLDGEPYDVAVPVTDDIEAAAAFALRLVEIEGGLAMVETATPDAEVVEVLFRVAGREAEITDVTVSRGNTWTLTFEGDVGDGTYSATVEVAGLPAVEVEFVVDNGELLDLALDPYDVAVPVTTPTELAEAFVLRFEEIASSEDVATLTADTGVVTVVFTPPGAVGLVADVVVPAAVAQVIDFTVLGDPAAASSITINGTVHNVDPTGKVNTVVRDEFIAAIEGGAQGAVVAATANGADKVRVTASVAGVEFTYGAVVAVAAVFAANVDVEGTAEETVAGSATAAESAEVTTPIGQPIPVGRFLVVADIDGQVGARLPEDGDEAGDVAGVVCRSHTFPARPDHAPADAGVPTLVSGDMLTVLERVTFYGRNVGDVAADTNGQVYVVISDAGGDEFGQARADADGGNAVAPTLFSARWLEPTAPGALGLVRVRR
jgi:hypothetical protein